ncbi:MAG: hypothetical protein AAFQ65_02690 [Myxococcota bacterium]
MGTIQIARFSLCLASAAALLACTSQSSESPGAEPTEDAPATEGEGTGLFGQLNNAAEMGKNLEQMSKKLEELQKRPAVDPVDFKALAALLPDELAGFPAKKKVEAETVSMGQYKISQAERRYAEGKSGLTVRIIDGAYTSFPMVSMVFMAQNVSREGMDGYERGTKVDNHLAFEKWQSERRRGELTVVIDDRFVVSVRAKDVDEKAAREVFSAIDIDALRSLSK